MQASASKWILKKNFPASSYHIGPLGPFGVPYASRLAAHSLESGFLQGIYIYLTVSFVRFITFILGEGVLQNL